MFKVVKKWRKQLGVIAVTVSVFIVLLLIVTFSRQWLTDYLDDKLLLGTPINFNALIISLWSALIVFVFIGIATLIVGIRKPEDDVIESRLRYLFTGEGVTQSVMSYNKEQVTKLSAFSTRGTIAIHVEEVSDSDGGFRIDVESTEILQNGFHNHPYVDEDFRIFVGADRVGNHETIGGINRVEFTSEIAEGPSKLIDTRVVLTKDVPKYKGSVTMEIEPNGTICYSVQYWIWCDQKEGFNIRNYRYSEGNEILLYNQSDAPIVVEHMENGKDRKSIIVKSKDHVHLFDSIVLSPECTWWMTIKESTGGAVAAAAGAVARAAEKPAGSPEAQRGGVAPADA